MKGDPGGSVPCPMCGATLVSRAAHQLSPGRIMTTRSTMRHRLFRHMTEVHAVAAFALGPRGRSLVVAEALDVAGYGSGVDRGV